MLHVTLGQNSQFIVTTFPVLHAGKQSFRSGIMCNTEQQTTNYRKQETTNCRKQLNHKHSNQPCELLIRHRLSRDFFDDCLRYKIEVNVQRDHAVGSSISVDGLYISYKIRKHKARLYFVSSSFDFLMNGGGIWGGDSEI